jgi:hypothetical protein
VKIAVRLRKGDLAWLAIAGGVFAYEKWVDEDADLLSHRAAAYRQRYPLLTTSVVLLTAFHLLEWLRPEVDPYCIAVRYVRRRGRAIIGEVEELA